MRMTGVIMSADLSGQAVLDNLFHPVDISKDKIHMPSVNHQPAAAINPSPPCAQGCDNILSVGIIKFRGDFSDLLCAEALCQIIIDANINICIRTICTPCSGTAQYHTDYARYPIKCGGDFI